MSGKVPRNAKGQLLPGARLNPAGPVGITGLQPYGRRSAYLLELYGAEDIKRIILNADGKQQKGISTYDLIILTHLAGTLGGDDRRLEREALLDRIEGKPVQQVDQRVVSVVCLTTDEEKEGLEMIKRYQLKHLTDKGTPHDS